MLRGMVAVTLCVAGLGLAASTRAAPGDLDPTFGVDPILGAGPFGPGVVVSDRHEGNAYARGLALQSDGKILFALGGTDIIERRLPDGLRDESFGPYHGVVVTGVANVFDVVVRGDGDLIFTGYYIDVEHQYRYAGFLGRVTPDGLIGGLGSPGPWAQDRQFERVAVAPDGRIVAAGAQIRGIQPPRFAVSRTLSDGTPDPTFGRRGRVSGRTGSLSTLDGATAIVLLPDGHLVAVGTDFSLDGGDVVLLRYTAAGRLDQEFGVRGRLTTRLGGLEQALDAALQDDGKIVVAGTTGVNFVDRQFLLLRYLADGTLDPSFGVGGVVVTDFGADDAEAYGVAIQQDGKIVVAGGVDETLALARYLPDGTLDPSFGTDGLARTPLPPGNTAEARELVIQPDGKLVVGGLACRQPPPASQPACFYAVLARYLPD